MKEIISFITLMLLAAAVVIAVVAYPTMLLWNWLMPVIFGLPQVTFWQSVGLLTLSTLLFWRDAGNSSK